jgi:hypothetical protein
MHDANNASNSDTYFFAITYMCRGITENIRGYNTLKRIWGSIFRNFSKTVGSMEILNAALGNKAGCSVQND